MKTDQLEIQEEMVELAQQERLEHPDHVGLLVRLAEGDLLESVACLELLADQVPMAYLDVLETLAEMDPQVNLVQEEELVLLA